MELSPFLLDHRSKTALIDELLPCLFLSIHLPVGSLLQLLFGDTHNTGSAALVS
jgi:hypothetical protein